MGANAKNKGFCADRTKTRAARGRISKQHADTAAADMGEAKENVALRGGRYSAGYGNIIELTGAQTLLTDAQVQEIVSRFDYQTAAAQLDVAVGRTPMP